MSIERTKGMKIDYGDVSGLSLGELRALSNSVFEERGVLIRELIETPTLRGDKAHARAFESLGRFGRMVSRQIQRKEEQRELLEITSASAALE